HGGAALLAQLNGEAVAADGDETQLDFGDVGGFHRKFLRSCFVFRSFALSVFTPVRATTAPCPASADSGWASSHLLQAHRQASSPPRTGSSGLAVLVPCGSATITR